MTIRHIIRTSLAVAALSLASNLAAADSPAFTRMSDIPGPDGRWDFASWDATHTRVIVAHGNDVLLVDPASPTAARAIGDIAGAHAALAIPGGNRILVSSSRDNTVRILDAVTGTQLTSISVAADPDATVLSPDGRTAYVMGADSGAISIVDLAGMTETARIALKPGLEVPVLFGNRMLAVNNESLSEVEVVDLATEKLVGTIPLAGCEGPTGLALADGSNLALSSCANGKAALVDLAARKVVQLLPIGLGPDTVIWDGKYHRFLVPCGKSGTLSLIGLNGRRARVAGSVKTDVSARTAAFDPVSGRVYLPAARFGPAAAGKKPDVTAGSFHIVVLSANQGGLRPS